jgi:hypothetical protein
MLRGMKIATARPAFTCIPADIPRNVQPADDRMATMVTAAGRWRDRHGADRAWEVGAVPNRAAPTRHLGSSTKTGI